jgi:D-serine deaminase-like pyridoxal phosphate-dependent protein
VRLDDLPTPCLVLDRPVLERNCARIAALAARHNVALRPHLKTAKSAAVACLATRGQSGAITVSTVAEAAYFVASGFRDLLYAVGIAAPKLDALAAIQRGHGARITLVTDSVDAVRATDARATSLDAHFDLLVELDTGGRRAGVDPDGTDLLPLAWEVHASAALRLAGVLTHAGHSYHARGVAEIRAIAEAERAGAVRAASRLREAGLACPTVSVGSTPTVVYAERLDGVTEVRPGVYTLFDLHQAALGTCMVEDVAVSVLATVIGHNRQAGRVLIDAGALALSKDLSASEFRGDVGYGLVCPAPVGAAPLAGVCVLDVHQEHGLIGPVAGAAPPWDELPVGARVRVLPNHACMTVGPYDRYHVVEGGVDVIAEWDKATGWR